MSPKLRKNIAIAIRYLLGIIFLLSGVGKLIDPGDARYLVELLATEYYWLIEYAGPIVITVSLLEIGLSVLLFWGRWISRTLGVSAATVILFTVVLAYFWVQGQRIENCGCFGAFGIGGGLQASLLRNGLLLVLIAADFLLEKRGSKNRSKNR